MGLGVCTFVSMCLVILMIVMSISCQCWGSASNELAAYLQIPYYFLKGSFNPLNYHHIFFRWSQQTLSKPHYKREESEAKRNEVI